MSDPIATDERQGMPSGSAMARTFQCPAWWQRSLAATLRPPDESAYAIAGQRAHELLAEEDEEDEEDSDEILMAVGICKEKTGMLLAQTGFDEYETHTEERIFLLDDDGNKVSSGRLDRFYIEGNKFANLDWKTGRKDVLVPAKNPQLIFGAVLIAQHYGTSEGFLGIVPAWRPTPPMAEIGLEDIITWRKAILEVLSETKGESPRAKAGPACDFCPVRPTCPEAWAIVEQASKLELTMHDTPDQIRDNFKIAKHAAATIKVFLEAVKLKLGTEPDAIPGLTIGKASETKFIPGSVENFDKLAENYSKGTILASVKFTPAAIAKALTGGKGAKAAQKAIEDEFEAIIEKKARVGSLELVLVPFGALAIIAATPKGGRCES